MRTVCLAERSPLRTQTWPWLSTFCCQLLGTRESEDRKRPSRKHQFCVFGNWYDIQSTYLIVNLVLFSGQAMHELPVGMGTSLAAKHFCYLVAREVAHALLILRFLSHWNPDGMWNINQPNMNSVTLEYQVSVMTTSAPWTASFGSEPHQIFLSHLRSLTRSHTGVGAWYAGFWGVATRKLWPSRG